MAQKEEIFKNSFLKARRKPYKHETIFSLKCFLFIKSNKVVAKFYMCSRLLEKNN